MDTGQLNAFITVAECQSFSKAAEQLHLTQSAVSKRVAMLESILDTVLFERFGQRIQITQAGKLLLSDARDILDKVSQMHCNSDINKSKISGRLRIATSHHLGLYRLPKILQSFVAKYPDVRLDMSFVDSEIAYEEVSQGTYDIAIATLPSLQNNQNYKKNTNIIITPLWVDHLMIMFAKNHPMAQYKEITTDIIADFPAILPDKNTFTRGIIDAIFSDNNIDYTVAFTTNYFETIKVMVETGMGWSVMPQIMQTDKLTARELPMCHSIMPSRQLGIILHKNKIITPALQALIDELELELK